MPPQAIGIVEDQLRPLVGGDPAGEADGQGVGVEQRARRDDLPGRHLLGRPAVARALADERKQVAAQRLPHQPQLLVRDGVHGIPERRVVVPLPPVGGDVGLEQLRQLGGHPGGHVDAVRDRADGFGPGGRFRPDGRPHLAGHVAVQLADRVDPARRAERQRRHVEQHPVAVAVVVGAQREELRAEIAEAAPGPGQVLLDEVEGERVVPGRHGRVRGEDGGLTHLLDRLGERKPLLDQFAHALQHDERGVPLVEVPDVRLDFHRPERAHTAQPQHDFLLDAVLLVPAVQPGRQLAVPGRVLREVGVEEVNANLPRLHHPDRREDSAIPERHGYHAGGPVGSQGGLDWRVEPIEPFVGFLLPPLGAQVLVEVPLRVHEPDAHERDTEVTGFLARVAREDAQAAGIERQRLVQGELGREVGHLLGPAPVPEPPHPPGVARRFRPVEAFHHLVVQGKERRVLGDLHEALGGNEPQHADGVVSGQPPERVVERAEDVASAIMPAPPEVGGQLFETVDACGQRRKTGISFHGGFRHRSRRSSARQWPCRLRKLLNWRRFDAPIARLPGEQP